MINNYDVYNIFKKILLKAIKFLRVRDHFTRIIIFLSFRNFSWRMNTFDN